MEEKAHRPPVVPSLAHEPSSRAHAQGDVFAGVHRRQLFPRQTGDLRGYDMTYLDIAREESNAEEGVATGLLRATSRLAVVKVRACIASLLSLGASLVGDAQPVIKPRSVHAGGCTMPACDRWRVPEGF